MGATEQTLPGHSLAEPAEGESALDPALNEPGAPPKDESLEAEILVEEISIDGMCGVY